ncbi:MAG: hypothetical protein HY207_00835 [Nitrospirae bacterium]|nr:hypothetical protein [Nitrospirota bacterium]
MRTSRLAWVAITVAITALGFGEPSDAGETAVSPSQDAATVAPTKRPRASSDVAPPNSTRSAKERTDAEDEMLNYLDVLEDLPVLDALDTIESLRTIEDKEEDER